MKKLVCLCFVFMFVFTSCSNSKEEIQELSYDGALRVQQIASIDGGFYYMDQGFLKFYDENSQQSVVVCTEVNCEESGEESPAFDPSVMGIYVHNEKLYSIDLFLNIVEQDFDGRNKKVVTNLKDHLQSEESDASFQTAFYVDGELYVQILYKNVSTSLDSYGSLIQQRHVIARFDASTFEGEELVENEEKYSISLAGVDGGNVIYGSHYLDETLDYEDYKYVNQVEVHAYAYNLETKESTLIVEEPFIGYNVFAAYENKVYIGNVSQPYSTIVYDLDGKEMDVFPFILHNKIEYHDYFYTSEGTLLSTKNEEVYDSLMSEEGKMGSDIGYVGSSAKGLVFMKATDEGTFELFYIDFDDFTEGNEEWIALSE